jgi:hypothetical protein
MRLLHTISLKVSEFYESIPPYAILSHTWGEKEISFQEIRNLDGLSGAAFEKIKKCCQTAASDGYEFVWIDTCCIDKTDILELSEAINSMYRWYQKAEVCYVYLTDVSSSQARNYTDFPQAAFQASRWFTRGWTLQELIAPSHVIFFSNDWQELGTKISLKKAISEVTGIRKDILMGASLDRSSIAQKMSWASRRQTTRLEDLSYCLMGIFGVNMPMLYGEGERAFIRLQEEIIKISDDHSILVWNESNAGYSEGVIACSPAAFLGSGHIIQSDRLNPMSIQLTNRGIALQVSLDWNWTDPEKPKWADKDKYWNWTEPERPKWVDEDKDCRYLATLNCHALGDTDCQVAIPLKKMSHETFSRDSRWTWITVSGDDWVEENQQPAYIPQKVYQEEHDDEICIDMAGLKKHGIFPCSVFPRDWVHLDGKVTSINQLTYSKVSLSALHFSSGTGESFAVVLKRGGAFGKLLTANVFRMRASQSFFDTVPLFMDTDLVLEGQSEDTMTTDRVIWQHPGGRLLISVNIRRKLVAGARRLVVEINSLDPVKERGHISAKDG